MSETEKHAAIVAEFVKGNTLDIGGGGFPVCKHAIQLDLPDEAYRNYNNTTRGESPIHWRGDALDLPFKDGVLDALHASHVLEDWALADWGRVLREWTRVIKANGFIIIAVPSHHRFRARVKAGQGDNLAHKFEPEVGDLSKFFLGLGGWEIIMDRFVNDQDPTEYSIVFVARKK